ncbi:MAG: hypothetical protein M3P40_03670 [Actinomycetota bacterium]|nr:hypothetical protein [Actinomycetota bacterium]
MSQPDPNHHIRRVVLPSGRSIEVVYFESPGDSTTVRPAAREQKVTDLHVCPQCENDMVYPVEWEEVSPTHWEVALRCPSCEWDHVGVYDQATVDSFDDELDRGTETLLRDLKRLTRANMEEELERFSEALGADALWPMDF